MTKVPASMETAYSLHNNEFFHLDWYNDPGMVYCKYQGVIVSEECFSFNSGTGVLTPETNCNTFLPAGSNVEEFIFKFHFREPEVPSLIFGDIKYRALVKKNNACHDPDTPISDTGTDRLSHLKNAALHYYRTKAGVPDDKHLLHTGGNINFYNSDSLINIEEVWKTGFALCKSTGSLAPHADSSIAVSC